MIDPIFHSENYLLTRKMLDAITLRQEAIAANIANAETPGYRRLDVAPNFADQLRANMEAGDFANSSADLQPTLVADTHARAVRPDGNNVEIERELLAMSKNTIEHEFMTQIITGHIKQMKMAITGRST